MKVLVFILLFVSSLFVKGQEDLLFPFKGEEFKWSQIEVKNARLKAAFLKKIRKKYPSYYDIGGLYPEEVKKWVHVVRFNNDTLDDIIFNGYKGLEPNVVTVYLNNGKSCDSVFEQFQGIQRVKVENNAITKFCIEDWGCCISTRTIYNTYSIDYTVVPIVFKRIFQMICLGGTEVPKSFFDEPIKFKTTIDQYNLRATPKLDYASLFFIWGEGDIKGNSAGLLPIGSTGYALAEKADASGKVWWFVAIGPEVKMNSPLFTTYVEDEGQDEVDEKTYYKLGWVSTKYVEKISE